MIRLNSNNSEFYKKFNRYPKKWNINNLHDLYLRLNLRFEKSNKNFWDYVTYLKTIIPREGNGEYVVYFNSTDSKKSFIRAFIIKDNGYTFRDFDMDRDSKISMILEDILPFGNEMKRLMSIKESRLKWEVYNLMNQKIQSLIISRMKKENKENKHYWVDYNSIHIIDIQGFRYIYHLSRGIIGTVREEEIIRI
jgi:hypothetical protein